jgi:TrmH family RNA methyltransferase
MLEIVSLKNPRVKQLLALQKPRDRKREGLLVVEGVREVSLAQQKGRELVTVYTCPTVYQEDADYPIDLAKCEHVSLSAEVYAKVAYREGTGGIIALVKTKNYGLKELPDSKDPLYVVLEKVEKPGNIGAILRTADAAGVDAVIVCDPATDFDNPNVIRSSVGCVFTVPVASATNEELDAWFKAKGVKVVAAALTAKQLHFHCDMRGPLAILMGSESRGLSDFWLKNATEQVIIPMRGSIDSMNVSNAAAILIYEALRQRLS